MYAQLFIHSPLLILPLVSLALFGAVFVAVVARVFARKASSYDTAAALPLDEAPRGDGQGARHV